MHTTPSTTDQNVKYKIELFGLFDLSNEQINDNFGANYCIFTLQVIMGSYGANYLFKITYSIQIMETLWNCMTLMVLTLQIIQKTENALNWLANNNGGFIDNGHNTFVMESPFTYNATNRRL